MFFAPAAVVRRGVERAKRFVVEYGLVRADERIAEPGLQGTLRRGLEIVEPLLGEHHCAPRRNRSRATDSTHAFLAPPLPSWFRGTALRIVP